MSSSQTSEVPSFQRGDFVVPRIIPFRAKVFGSREMTPDEKTAWYAAPENQGIDDAGESKITSGTFYRELPEGTQMIVTRARVSAKVGWSNVGGLCEVKVLATNEILLVSRKSLVLGQ